MLRPMIQIDEERCDGCGLCVTACAEGALAVVDGKARLISDSYCDGLGACLPVCPRDALQVEAREAPAFDQAAVTEHLASVGEKPEAAFKLRQWPIQLALAPLESPAYQDADLLLAADCSAFSHGDFQQHYMLGKTLLIACPKLDSFEYREKLVTIFSHNAVRSLTVVRMEVPCCGGIVRIAQDALAVSGATLALRVVTLGIDGVVLEDRIA
ncbi:MAG: 4Fe-4S binding protein [Coriobacteriales bacterium]|jgi:Pyruvate/2-oxoacid:ferredoxin oxidoreductase delta subunit|nr:4Fe-4S binding protein [Coriobacteriales bacterium]